MLIRVSPVPFSLGDRCGASATLVIGAQWLSCNGLREGRELDVFGWSRGGR